MASDRRPPLLLILLSVATIVSRVPVVSSSDLAADGTVLELDDSNFDSAIASFDFVLVDFYAPWCGHCKRLAPELDAAAPILAGLKEPVVVAKVNADKHKSFISKYEIDGFPTLKLFVHGIPIDYSGPRKAELLVRFLKKFAAPDVSILAEDSGVRGFVETAGTDFPIFIGFGLNETVIAKLGKKHKKRAWFSVAKDFSDELMVEYDFDKVPALVAFQPKHNENNVFYGPFEGEFLEEFIKQNHLPLAVPITYETLKLLNDDDRKIVLTLMHDVFDEEASKLVKTLKAAASANRDLVFAYVGTKQWQEFARTFEVNDKTKLPKVVVWDGREEYHIAEDLQSLNYEDNLGSQMSRFLQAYRDGKLTGRKIHGPSFSDFLTDMRLTLICMGVLVTLVMVVICYMVSLPTDAPSNYEASSSSVEGNRAAEANPEEYGPGDKED